MLNGRKKKLKTMKKDTKCFVSKNDRKLEKGKLDKEPISRDRSLKEKKHDNFNMHKKVNKAIGLYK